MRFSQMLRARLAVLFFSLFLMFIAPAAFAAEGLEQPIQDFLTYLVEKVPIALTVYLVLSAAYQAFCAVAAMTKTDKDDKWVTRLKIFFSIPIKKK